MPMSCYTLVMGQTNAAGRKNLRRGLRHLVVSDYSRVAAGARSPEVGGSWDDPPVERKLAVREPITLANLILKHQGTVPRELLEEAINAGARLLGSANERVRMLAARFILEAVKHNLACEVHAIALQSEVRSEEVLTLERAVALIEKFRGGRKDMRLADAEGSQEASGGV